VVQIFILNHKVAPSHREGSLRILHTDLVLVMWEW